MSTEQKGRSNTVLIALVLLLLMTNAFTYWKLTRSQQQGQALSEHNDAITAEKENVTKLLEDMLVQYDTLSTENEQLKAEMEGQRQRIEDLLDQVKRGNYDLAKAKKEIGTLKKTMQGYVVQIDSLNQANQALTADNINLTQQLGEVTGQKQALEGKAQDLETQIAKGSVLHTTTISAGALYVRNNGKQVETNRANKAEVVKCCFTLGENKVTRSGDKVLYMRIISPDGNVLPSGDPNNRFSFDGTEGEYGARREVNYQNQPVDVCIFWNASEELRSGHYIVDVYEAGSKISTAGFDLK